MGIMKDKTIWILNHHAITPNIGGGTRHYDFASELVRRGYTVYIFASSFIHYQYVNLLAQDEPYRDIDIDGIHWVWINTRSYRGNGKDRILGMIQYYRFMTRNYRKFSKPDCIIGSAVHLLACAAGCRIAKILNVKCISEIRDLWPETLIELGSLRRNSLIAKAMYLLEKYVYRKSDKIVVTAPGMADYIEQRGIDRGKIVYINNGVDVKSFDDRLKQYHCGDVNITFNQDRFRVLYLGAFGRANAIDTLIDAAIKLKNMEGIDFILIGDGPEKKRLETKASDSGLCNMFFYPSVSKQYVPDILTKADCLVFSAVDSPLYKYGISANKLFDYLCSGKPIIFAINTINDIIETSGAGISIDPENPVQMAEAILSLYNIDPLEREKIGAKGRVFIEKNFDIPILVNRLEEVINA